MVQGSPAKPAIADLAGNGPKQAVYSKDFDCRSGNYASEIDTLAKALTDSELRRTHLIEEFQAEREKYITQYKQMKDALKGFMDNPL